MDLYCPRCSEPWDLDELHYVDGLTFDQARRAFRAEGCGAFGTRCERDGGLRAEASAVLMDLLGDDVDGVAAMLEDFEWAGMLDE
jgi:hypothetical protein